MSAAQPLPMKRSISSAMKGRPPSAGCVVVRVAIGCAVRLGCVGVISGTGSCKTVVLYEDGGRRNVNGRHKRWKLPDRVVVRPGNGIIYGGCRPAGGRRSGILPRRDRFGAGGAHSDGIPSIIRKSGLTGRRIGEHRAA